MGIPEISSSKATCVFEGSLTVGMTTKNGEKYFQCSKDMLLPLENLTHADDYEREYFSHFQIEKDD